MTEAALDAQAWRRRRSARHAAVLGGVAGALGLAGLVAGGAVLGAWSLPFVADRARPVAAGPTPAPSSDPRPPTCQEDGTAPVAAAAETTVTVRNGTTREGLAGGTGDELTARGFTVADVANADRTASGLTQVRFRPEDQANALAVVLHTGATDIVADPASEGVVLTLGDDFTSLRAPEDVDALLAGGEVFPGCRAAPVG
ncbi:MAG: LytR C-terminal domain-containing protein [Kineosporiaceae bacterium]